MPTEDVVYLYVGRDYPCHAHARQKSKLTRKQFIWLGSDGVTAMERLRGCHGPLRDPGSKFRLRFCIGDGFTPTQQFWDYAHAAGFEPELVEW